jgi:hypothetical protein
MQAIKDALVIVYTKKPSGKGEHAHHVAICPYWQHCAYLACSELKDKEQHQQDRQADIFTH